MDPNPHTPSWHSAYLLKHRDSLPHLTFTSILSIHLTVPTGLYLPSSFPTNIFSEVILLVFLIRVTYPGVGHATGIGEELIEYTVLVGEPQGNNHQEDLDEMRRYCNVFGVGTSMVTL
jgi:hypothetical protein